MPALTGPVFRETATIVNARGRLDLERIKAMLTRRGAVIHGHLQAVPTDVEYGIAPVDNILLDKDLPIAGRTGARVVRSSSLKTSTRRLFKASSQDHPVSWLAAGFIIAVNPYLSVGNGLAIAGFADRTWHTPRPFKADGRI